MAGGCPGRVIVPLSLPGLVLAVLAAALVALPGAVAAQPRIKDLAAFVGIRENPLLGYGVVIGLQGTGDSARRAPFTREAISVWLERLGTNVGDEQFATANVASVLVTATLPPFARSGSKLDVSLSSIGDASSLLGGTLILTPLYGADGEVYAAAQGPIIVSGFEAAGAAERVTEGVPTNGAIPNGATVEREIGYRLPEDGFLRLALNDPDITTAHRVAATINRRIAKGTARAEDPATVLVSTSASGMRALTLMGQIEGLRVTPDTRARVVIDQRSGTIVLGENVRIGRVAVSQGNLNIRVTERPVVSQPNPFAEGETIVLPTTEVGVDEDEDRRISLVEETATLADLVTGLNALGVGPRDMIDILQAIHAAGALHADIVIR
ncbi:MAG: flagellar basal body P-ring protein FlgI [Pseudomonadota bacterium]